MSDYDYSLDYNLCLSQYDNHESIQRALNLIQEAVLREDNEKHMYSYLINNSMANDETMLIMEIYKNELKHSDYFNQIYNQLSKKMPQFQTDLYYTLPKSFCHGLSYALKEEEKKFEKYKEIYMAIKSEDHKYKLVEILTDEIWHIRILKFLNVKNNCQG